MNLLITYISSHLLSIIESELASNAPEIIAITQKEIQLLISKLESYIDKKAPEAAPIATPVLNTIGSVANSAVSAEITNLASSVKS